MRVGGLAPFLCCGRYIITRSVAYVADFLCFCELNSKRVLKIIGVYATSAISDVNDLPIDCIGIVYNSALHRPTPDGTTYAIFCLGNENDNVNSQFGYTIGKYTVSYVYRNYNYQNQLWSDWKQITTKY